MANVTSALDYRENCINELKALIKRMHSLMLEMDHMMDANGIALEWEHADTRAAITVDINRLVGNDE